MKKVELLSPVGNKEMLYQAIHNGADAIYLSGKLYGARKFAKNFTNEELVDVIKYAHLYDVRVFVTVNIMIYENELEDALEYIEFLYKNQVDALIMQDIGLITLVRKYYPNLEIHASTQCHNHNKSGLELWRELGIKRVVLDREMTISEIKELDIDIEKEVFIYGALCVCYSGCCLFSSLNGGRSGNRGECVGCCRLPYKLLSSNKKYLSKEEYLLSTKELNTLNALPKLIELGIDSFKIEGRMKSPTYVGYVTKCARKIIDAYYEGKERVLTKEEDTNLRKLFNRGFTKGYILNEKNIMNTKSPNHQGIEIGKVIEIQKDKVKIEITKDNLHQEDGIRFKNTEFGMIINHLYNKKGLLVNKIEKGEIGYLDKKANIKIGDTILKTIDSNLNNELNHYQERKIPITMKVSCKINQAIEIEINDGKNKISKKGEIVEKATNQEVDRKSFEKQLSKLGNTPYILEQLDIEKENNIFIRLSSLNMLRRLLVEELTELRKNKKIHEVKINEKPIKQIIENKSNNSYKIHVLTRTEEQLKTCIKHHIDSIYTTDYSLYKKYKDEHNVYYRIERVNIKEKKYKNERLLVGDLGSTYLYGNNNEIITDYYLNVANHANIDLLKRLNVKRITLSVELNFNQVKELMSLIKEKQQIEIIIYGRLELMLVKHNILNEFCYLEDKNHYQYPVLYENNLSHILQHTQLNQIKEIKKYQNLGIENYRIELYDEGTKDIEKILKEINKEFKLNKN